jgi:hypothetical protein
MIFNRLKIMADSARYDLRSMSSLQTELHRPLLDEELNTRFGDRFVKLARNGNNRVPLKPVKSTKGVVDYHIEDNFDYLVSSTLHQEVTSVEVKTDYKDTIQIRWPDYFGLTLAKTAKLKYDDNIVINTLTPIGMFKYMKDHLNPQAYQKFLYLIGHRKNLVTWTDHLNHTTIGVPLPWCYSVDCTFSFPVFLLKERKQLVHRFEFYPIEKLLRMRQRVDESTWKEIPFDPKYITYSTTNDKFLETPDLIAKMAVMDDEEKEELLCEIQEHPDKVWQRYIDDFVVIPSSEEFKEGHSGTMQLNDPAPCKALSFCAINSQAYKYNNYFQFTDEHGDHPILTYSLSYGNAVRIPETTIFMNELDTFDVLPSNFDQVGFTTHCFDLQPNFFSACSGPVFNGLNAVFKVQFDEPKDESAAQKYTLVVVLWVTKKLILKADEKDPTSFKVSIEPKIVLK